MCILHNRLYLYELKLLLIACGLCPSMYRSVSIRRSTELGIGGTCLISTMPSNDVTDQLPPDVDSSLV